MDLTKRRDVPGVRLIDGNALIADLKRSIGRRGSINWDPAMEAVISDVETGEYDVEED